jgi:gamma-glutamyltranspeptidase/glutathione hydrolase
MELAHAQHGKLAWARLFAPAIRLARQGFAISPRMHEMLGDGSGPCKLVRLGPFPILRDRTGGRSRSGPVVTNAELAQLLENVAARGPEHFYNGPPAQALVRTVTTAARNPSAMTAGDLTSYDAKRPQGRCAACIEGHRICGMGPPSSGATTVFAILKQLERFDLAGDGAEGPGSLALVRPIDADSPTPIAMPMSQTPITCGCRSTA